ncbi:MAG: nuclear transport factor 2 family protein [Thermoleophilaceae bacterium]|nr:nuclear transport factor 2 family protein [Thermoleophilaceae bacterium]
MFRGRQGIRDYFHALEEAFDEVHLEVKDVTDATHERVVVLVDVSGRGKGSGIPVGHRFGQVWTFARGEVVRVESYLDPRDAREAADLSE